MAEQLFALQRDLDMVIDDVQNLKRSYNLLDEIATVVRDCRLEQLFQAEQMRRMDARFITIEARLDKVEARLDKVESRLDKIETTLELLTKQMGMVMNRLDVISNRLNVISNHLGVKSDE